MMASKLIHYIGGCYDCDKNWETRNVIGLAAQHHYKTGHCTWAETGHSYTYGGPDEEQAQTPLGG